MEEKRIGRTKPGFFWAWKEALIGVWSLLVGLYVTGSNFIKPIITMRYPWKVVDKDNISTFRGHIELVGKPKEPEVPKCIVCMMCVKACPSGCISVKLKKEPKPAEGEEGDKKKKAPKTPEKFVLNFNLCSLCGLCVQNCPVKSLEHSNNVYLADFSRKAFEYDLLARLTEQAKQKPIKESAAEKAEEKAEAGKGDGTQAA